MKIRFAKEKTKSKKREGRESKEGPTCQRERKVDAPEEEHEKSKRAPSYPSVIQYIPAFVLVRSRDLTGPHLQPTDVRKKNILFSGQSDST